MAETTSTSQITLRLPTVYAESNTLPGSTAPAPDWLAGRWYITHSSLPLWKDKRDVAIDYTLLPADASGVSKVEDTTSYRPLDSTTVKTIRGADTPRDGRHQGIYDWRGYGWLKVASSHWEILGHGEGEGGRQWMVTHFHKTLFTPEGIDIYKPVETQEAIKGKLRELGHEGFGKLVAALFEVRQELDEEMEGKT